MLVVFTQNTNEVLISLYGLLMQKRSQLGMLTKRDRIADVSLCNWYSVYLNTGAFLRELPTRKRRRAVASLRNAHEVLQRLIEMMRADSEFLPEITVHTKDRIVRLNVVDLLAGGSLLSIANWLDSWEASKGPPELQSIIAQAAIELGKISRSTTGKPDWAWVEKRIKNKFGGPTGKSLYRLVQKWKEKKSAGINQRQKQAFKLFADNKSRVASKREIDAVFSLVGIRNALRQ